jgi:hypothetical protein
VKLTSWLLDNFGASLRAGGVRLAASRAALALLRLVSRLAPAGRVASTEARAAREGREVCVVADGRVSLGTTYAEWVAPLARLPQGAAPAEFVRAAEGLPGYDADDAQHLFPLDIYLRATRDAALAGVAMTHVVAASRVTAHELLPALTGLDAPEVPPAPPPALLFLREAPAPALCNQNPLH